VHKPILTDLDGLLDLVHDRFFDLTECEFLRERREFRLSLAGASEGPYRDKLLRVTDVLDVAVRDDAQTQVQDINEVVMLGSTVRIISGFPVEITLTVGLACEIHILKYPGRRERH
jgi:hypothetical protein